MSHKSEHNFFLDKVAVMAKTYADGSLAMSFEAFVFLRDWIVEHVLSRDAEYVAYLGGALIKAHLRRWPCKPIASVPLVRVAAGFAGPLSILTFLNVLQNRIRNERMLRQFASASSC